jgi:hypothetical protein
VLALDVLAVETLERDPLSGEGVNSFVDFAGVADAEEADRLVGAHSAPRIEPRLQLHGVYPLAKRPGVLMQGFLAFLSPRLDSQLKRWSIG